MRLGRATLDLGRARGNDNMGGAHHSLRDGGSRSDRSATSSVGLDLTVRDLLDRLHGRHGAGRKGSEDDSVTHVDGCWAEKKIKWKGRMVWIINECECGVERRRE